MNKQGILINDTSNESHIGCDTVISTIKRLCKENGIEITKTFKRNEECSQAIKDCDIVIINGEGSCHEHYGRRWLVPILKAIPEDKKAVLINSLWNNMGTLEGMEKLSIISLRESYSLESFKKDCPSLSVRLVPDVTLAAKTNCKIGYGDSVLGKVTSALEEFDNYFPITYRRIAKGINVNTKSLDGYIRWLKSLDIYVTGRFHGVCLSVLTETPFLAFPSTVKKIEGMLKDMNCEELLIHSTKEIPDKCSMAFLAIPKIKTYTAIAQLKIWKLFKDIGELVNE